MSETTSRKVLTSLTKGNKQVSTHLIRYSYQIV